VKLAEIASVLRSKNADPFITTCDIFIPDESAYLAVKGSGALTRKTVASAYGIPEDAVLGIFFIDSVQAIKVSFFKYAQGRYIASGDLEDLDVLGAQQHVRLVDFEIDLSEWASTRGTSVAAT
jgi:hypothetical protein